MSDRAERMKTVTKLSTSAAEKSASKIQAAFRKHQARLKLKKQAAWQIHEKLEYSSEQTEAKVSDDELFCFSSCSLKSNGEMCFS